jgi:hypothetical protein
MSRSFLLTSLIVVVSPGTGVPVYDELALA